MFLDGLRDNVDSRENGGIEKNVTVHVAVVGGGVALGEGEQEVVYEGEVVRIGLEGGDDIDMQGGGITDEGR